MSRVVWVRLGYLSIYIVCLKSYLGIKGSSWECLKDDCEVRWMRVIS